MVPLSERIYRLYGEKIPKVIECLRLRLERLLKAKENPVRAKIAFRALYLLIHGDPDSPRYPEFSWDYQDYFLEIARARGNVGNNPFYTHVLCMDD